MSTDPTLDAPLGEPPKKRPAWLFAAIAGGLGCLGIAVLGLFATFVTPEVFKQLALAKRGKARADIVAIASALEEYATDHDTRYPDGLDDLVTPNAAGKSYFHGRRELPRDPWKRSYLYEPPRPDHSTPRVFTLGKDGLPGGAGEDADIDSDTLR